MSSNPILEKLSDRFLRVGQHPFKLCIRMDKQNSKDSNHSDKSKSAKVCGCCHSDSPLYSKLWPVIFFFSALTDFPMPLPTDKKPGQHRDWGYIPVIVVSGFSIFIYYGYLSRIILVLLKALNRKQQAIGYLIPSSIFFLFFMISYLRVVTQLPGQPKIIIIDEKSIDSSINSEIDSIICKDTTKMTDDTILKLTRKQPDTILGKPKWCKTCQNWKPDRTHHCRVCDACVLRMDHHCPWVNGCVGAFNYRFYIQFLCYVSLLSIWIFSTSLATFIEFHGFSTFDRLALAIVILTGIVVLLIGPFTMSHLWLVLLNRTTIENNQYQSWNKEKISGNDDRLIDVFTKNGKNVFDQGYHRNWVEVMGNNKLLWFCKVCLGIAPTNFMCNIVPLRSKEDKRIDGVHYGYNMAVLQDYKNEDQTKRQI